jgi:hypothetical protein
MEMNLRQEGLSIPPSGTDFVPAGYGDFTVTEPGGKCVHGVYIPSNHADQSFSEHCHICTSLKAYCEKTKHTLEQANLRIYLWQNFSHEEAVERIKQLEEEYVRFQNSNSPDPGA